MSRKMLINASEPEEVRVAIVEGSILDEYYVERMSVESVLGNVYKGRVTNVEPSIGAAFIDFGGTRHGFLHVSDVIDSDIFERGRLAAEAAKEAAEEAANEAAEAKAAKAKKKTTRKRSAKAATKGAEEAPEDVDASEEDEAGAEPGDDVAEARAEKHDEPRDEPEEAAGDGEELPDGADLEEVIEDVEVSAEADKDEEDEEDAGTPDVEAAAEDDEGEAGDVDGNVADAPVQEEEVPEVDGNRADPVDADTPDGEDAGATRSRRSRRGGRGRGGSRRGGASKAKESSPAPAPARAPVNESRRRENSISDMLKKGQEVIVQVTKDGIGTKGPTLTTYVSLPGRYLVLMPGLDRKGVSRKIDDGKERDRLKKVLGSLDTRDGLGFIVRTAGVGQTQRALQKDYKYLTKLWDQVEKNAKNGGLGKLLYRESDLVIRTIRDVYGPEMGEVIIDEDDCARRAREFLAMVAPRAAKQVKLYEGERPLFSAYGIEEEIGELFTHRVELPSGGSLVIEQTEALVAIDVNSGRFRDEEDLEETAYKINLEAADAIARQLRLRDLGGVIVVDFIDMRTEKRRRAIERGFKSALSSDRARIKVARISPFGTIEMTRQRVRPSLRHSIFHRCPGCRGAGYVATQETFELNLVRQIKLLLARKNAGLEVFLNSDNAEFMWNRKRDRLTALEKEAKKPVVLRVEEELRSDEFRVVPLDQKRAAAL